MGSAAVDVVARPISVPPSDDEVGTSFSPLSFESRSTPHDNEDLPAARLPVMVNLAEEPRARV